MNRDEILRQFLASKGVTKCPPAADFASQAKPLVLARIQRERTLTEEVGNNLGDEEVQEVERGAQRRYLEIQGIRD